MRRGKFDVGYTTGVYDLFHIGHLKLLQRAKSMCRTLIVGVTADELVSYKNKTSIIPFSERKAIIESLDCVDHVVVQDSMDKFAAWEKYKFNAMFVGSDWKGTEKWNKLEEQFAEVDVPIVYFPYTQTTSTTHLKKILEREKLLNH